MDEKTAQKVNKLAEFAKNPELAIFEEIQQIGETLSTMCDKEMPEPLPFPEIPEPKETNMTETNDLLKQLIAKEDVETEPLDISVTLKIV